jgi:phage gpG-like protein
MNSIYYVAGDYAAVVRNPVEYAAIHNEGGVVQPTVTPKMRKFAWAKFYTAAGLTKGEKIPASVPEEAARWRALALTKKTKLNITMPRRQFIGVSRELEDKISASLEAELLRLFEN